MAWTKEDTAYLASFKHNTDSSDIRFKEIIKRALLDNKYIIHALNDKELEESDAEPDEYFGKRILPYFLIANTQHNVGNFLCYDIGFKYTSLRNELVRNVQITFYILCEEKNIIDVSTGIARHDLLAALLIDEFDWKNYFGSQIHLTSDLATVIDNDYMTRTLIFQGEFISSILKNKNNNSKVINSEVKTLG